MPEKIIFDAPANEAPIPTLYAFLSIDETGEGICSMFMANKWWSMVTSKPSVVEKMKVAARSLARASGRPIKLVKFTGREEIETFGAQ